jgi:hypothetical protein
MTPSDFIRALETELRRLGRPFDRNEVFRFVKDLWPRIAANPSPDFWASKCFVAMHQKRSMWAEGIDRACPVQ